MSLPTGRGIGCSARADAVLVVVAALGLTVPRMPVLAAEELES